EVCLGRDYHNEQSYSDAIAHEIDREMKSFIEHCYRRAEEILTEHKDKLELIAQTLLEVETLDAFQIKSLFEKGVLPEPEELDEEDNDVKVNIQSKEDDEPDDYEKTKAKIKKKHEEKIKAIEEGQDRPEEGSADEPKDNSTDE